MRELQFWRYVRACDCTSTVHSPLDQIPGTLQADKNSPLENKAVDRSSKLIVGASALGTAALTALSFS